MIAHIHIHRPIYRIMSMDMYRYLSMSMSTHATHTPAYRASAPWWVRASHVYIWRHINGTRAFESNGTLNARGSAANDPDG